MKLGDVAYEKDFYWKGKRYVQFLRVKNMTSKGSFKVTCYEKANRCNYVEIPSYFRVKPVISISELIDKTY